jgi:hypothetical protein
MDYIDAIKKNHCVVSFSQAKQVFYISLWNGVLRDGLIDDIDIQFFEAKFPKIINDSLSFDNQFITLSITQLTFLSTIF